MRNFLVPKTWLRYFNAISSDNNELDIIVSEVIGTEYILVQTKSRPGVYYLQRYWRNKYGRDCMSSLTKHIIQKKLDSRQCDICGKMITQNRQYIFDVYGELKVADRRCANKLKEIAFSKPRKQRFQKSGFVEPLNISYLSKIDLDDLRYRSEYGLLGDDQKLFDQLMTYPQISAILCA